MPAHLHHFCSFVILPPADTPHALPEENRRNSRSFLPLPLPRQKMLGKRPHQIHKTTSMSQIRPSPPTRPRVSLDSGTSKKDSLGCASQQCSDHQRFHEDSYHNHHHDAPHVAANDGGTLMSKLDASPSSAVTHSHGFVKKHGTVQSFMEACYSCKRPLGHGRDIFMYRGDAAFCTEECRMKQMSRDEQRQQQRSMQNGSSNIGCSKVTHRKAVAPTSAF